MRIDTKRMDSFLARLLGKNGEIGRYLVPTYQSLWVFSLCLSVSRKQNIKQKAINSKVKTPITTS